MSWSAVISHRLGEFHLDVTLDGDTDLVAIVGPNGSGKTSVLRTIAGAVKPDFGQISIGGCVVLSTDSGVNLAPEDRAVGYVPQGFGLFQHLNVLHNVGFGLSTWRRPLPDKEKSERAFEALVQLGAEHLVDRSPRSLSGGEQQRVALARALVINPEILLLDEPFSTLDPVSRREVRGVLSERLSSLGIPTILVTHRADDVAALGAKLCVMREGRVIQSGTIDEVLASPADAFVEAFLATLRPR